MSLKKYIYVATCFTWLVFLLRELRTRLRVVSPEKTVGAMRLMGLLIFVSSPVIWNLAMCFGYLDPQAVAAYTQPQVQPGSGDLQQTLQKLADLRDQGLLSQAEFDAKKRELLSRV